MNQVSGWIRDPAKYQAYVERTDEKEILKSLLCSAYHRGELPIKPGDIGKKILDLGCGLGTHTAFLAALFSSHDIYAVERSKDFLAYAEQNVINTGNITFYCGHFEDFSASSFDFVLCSHVLQYIDSSLDEFLLRLRDCLSSEGEAWVIVQEGAGINQIVQAAIPYLAKLNPYFRHWFVHDHVRQRLSELGIEYATSTFASYFKAPNFEHPQGKDLLCLDFLLLDSYEQDNKGLSENLSMLRHQIVVNGYIRHEVGVTRIHR